MAGGNFLIASKCHKDDQKIFVASIAEAWATLRTSFPTPLPALKKAVLFEADVTMEFESVEEAVLMDGTKLLNGEGHVIHCRRNRHATSLMYSVKGTFLMPVKNLMTALKRAFPMDNFLLYNRVIMNTSLDE